MNGWTDERIKRLRQLWDENTLSCSAIAAELGGGLSRNAVIGKVHRLGLPKHARVGPRYAANRPAYKHPTIKRRSFTRIEPAIAETTLQQIEERPAPSEFLGIAFMSLKPGECRYPRGDGASVLFCGQPVSGETSYCRSCYRLCHQGFGTHLNISEAERERRRIQGTINLRARKSAA